MKTPDNHLARRAEDRASQGYTPEKSRAWPLVIVTLLCWCVLICAFSLLALPFLQWILDGHAALVKP